MSLSPLTATRYFFCASHESVYSAMKRGIWHEMPLNHQLDPIDSTGVTLVKRDGSEASATDLKLHQYVRIITNPGRYLAHWQGNLASVFIIELDPRVLERPDIIKIKRIRDGAFELAKNIMIDPGSIKRVIVFSKGVEKKLRDVVSQEKFGVPIVTEPSLFVSEGAWTQPVHEDFTIARPSTAEIPPEAPKGSCKIVKGDLLRSPMQAHVNTVNCVGVMGKGIALAFKRQYPAMFEDYRAKCARGQVQLGKPYCFRVSPDRIIVNFPTKGDWRENSSLQKVEEGLQYLVAHAKEWGIESIAMPPLGCSNGKLNWADVFPLLQLYLPQLGIPFEIYAPHEADSFGQELHLGPTKRNGEGPSSTRKKPHIDL